MPKPQFSFQLECKSFERVAGEGVKIKGYASTPDLDRQFDIVLPTAFKKSLQNYYDNVDDDGNPSSPALLRSHDEGHVVGKILMMGDDAPVITDQGLMITALVTEAETAAQVVNGELQTLSMGYMPMPGGISYEMMGTGKIDPFSGQELQVEARILKDVDLLEVSIVSTPANPKALFTVQKSLQKFFSTYPSPIMKNACEYCTDGKKNLACGKIGTKAICKTCIDKIEFKGDAAAKVKEGATVQSVVLTKDAFSRNAAKTWVKDHGFSEEKSAETTHAYVFAQCEAKVSDLEPQASDDEGVSFLLLKKEAEETDEQKAEREATEARVKADKEAAEAAAAAGGEGTGEGGTTEGTTETETTETADEKAAAEAAAEEAGANGGEADAGASDAETTKAAVAMIETFLTGIAKKSVATPAKKEEKKTQTVSVHPDMKAMEILTGLMAKMAEFMKTHNDAIAEIQEKMTKIPVRQGKSMLSFQHAIVATGTKKSSTENTDAEPDHKSMEQGFAAMLRKSQQGGPVVLMDDGEDD